MVLGEVANGLASAGYGLTNIWGYNRESFLYDRRMRMETELKVVDWRAEQANQWREDVRDLTGLTEQKMQSYMVVNTLQLSMVVILYAEGRLQPGTPHWLLHMYLLTLSGSFMYLLMSVWLAMHASVVVACEKARLLTQNVRLPIPTWRQFERMRTSAAAYENLGSRSLRVPFVDTVLEERLKGSASSSSANATTPASASSLGHNPICHTKGQMPMNAGGAGRVDDQAFGHGAPLGYDDTWGLETVGSAVHELAERPLDSNLHVNLVRRAQSHYQCHDAFARISMAFGTNQLLVAISYFVMGYVGVGDGAPWPAIIIAAIMVSIAIALMQLDISFTRSQHMQAFFLMVMGPTFTAMSVVAWCMSDTETRWHIVCEILLPPAFLSHGIWLLFALRACDVKLHPGGSMLPTKFRLIMYLDVFGWIRRQQKNAEADENQEVPSKTDGGYKVMVPDGQNSYSCNACPAHVADEQDGGMEDLDNPLTCTVLSSKQTTRNLRERSRLVAEIRTTLESWHSASTMQIVDEYTKKRVKVLSQRLHAIGEKGLVLEGFPSSHREAIHEPEREISPGKGNDFNCQAGLATAPQTSVTSQDSQATAGWQMRAFDGLQGMSQTWQPSQELKAAVPHEQFPAQSHAGQWLTGYHCTDFGTEIPYKYDPQTGNVQHTHVQSCPSSSPSPPQPMSSFQPFEVERCVSREPTGEFFSEGDVGPRSLSVAEQFMDEVEALCRKVEAQPLYEASQHADYDSDDNDGTGSMPSRLLRGATRRSQAKAAHVAPWLFGDLAHQPRTSSPSMSSTRKGKQQIPCTSTGSDKVTERMRQGSVVSAEINKDEIVMSIGPDKLPWFVFRAATLTLVCLWLVSPLLLYGFYPYGRSEFGPLPPVHGRSRDRPESNFAEKEDPDGTFSGLLIDSKDFAYDLEPSLWDYTSMPSLPAGRQLEVQWPFKSAFKPRALTTDSSGTHLVVSEDFGVYFGLVVDGKIEVENPDFRGLASISQDEAKEEREPRLLRGSSGTGLRQSSFMHMPHCTALEGKELQDVAVVCYNQSRALCRVLVLHSYGRRIAECPLYSSWDSGASVQPASSPEGEDSDSSVEASVKPLSEWEIAGSWLDTDLESVESLAVNPECDLQAQGDSGAHGFDAAEVGCVVVGTSSGRLVQLRRHVSNEHELVPEWGMQERRGKVAQGSLQVLAGDYVVMLRSEIGVMQAINTEKGTVLGQWRLPDNAVWKAISGGVSSLFILGYRQGTDESGAESEEVIIWTFPMPPELQKLFAADSKKNSPASADA